MKTDICHIPVFGPRNVAFLNIDEISKRIIHAVNIYVFLKQNEPDLRWISKVKMVQKYILEIFWNSFSKNINRKSDFQNSSKSYTIANHIIWVI